jgi:hypothetical protein
MAEFRQAKLHFGPNVLGFKAIGRSRGPENNREFRKPYQGIFLS